MTAEYWDGMYDGMRHALRIVQTTEPAPQTRCGSTDAFNASRRRIARVLAEAAACNRSVGAMAREMEQQ